MKKLDKSLGDKLYMRVGRDLVLTDDGITVYRYADEILSIRRELNETIKGRPTPHGIRLVVGLPDLLPKLIAFRLLEPVLHLHEKVQIVCREGSMPDLLAKLATQELDVVFANSPASPPARPPVSVKAFNHTLGQCGIGIFGVPELCNRFGSDLPN